MRSTNSGAIKAAKRAVDLVLVQGELDKNPVPYFEPTNLIGLPDAEQQSQASMRDENDQGNRIRAASHLGLQSASQALAAALDVGALSVTKA